MKQIDYNVNNLTSFDREWLLHKKCSEWWYLTSILKDSSGNLYSVQYTFLRMRLFAILKPFILMLAITDFQTKKHYYSQSFTLSKKNIRIDENHVESKSSSVIKTDSGMLVNCAGDNFAFTLDLEYGKGAVWHCDNGKLFMGVESEKQTTFYYSYTNMPTKGKINLDGREILVEGNTWFDKQGGNFNFLSTHTHWEWFSMRFYNNEEIMLFNFPQQNYADRTYIKADKSYHRLNNYSMKPLNSVEVNGYKFSCGWEVDLPNVKDGHYTIIPVIEGQLNLAYFEQLCRIYDSNKKEVGLCFVELLPGVYNKKLDAKLLIKKV